MTRDVQGEGLAWVAGAEPTPQVAAAAADNCRKVLEQVGDPEFREVALGELEGTENEELARRLNCFLRTMKRDLHLIRKREGSLGHERER